MHDTGRAAAGVESNVGRLAAQHDLAARLRRRVGQCMAEPPRAAADIASAAGQISALRDREQDPPHRVGIVVPIGEIGGQRTFQRLVATERPIEDLADRSPPIANQRGQLEEGADTFARIAEGLAPAAERSEADRDAFHVAQHGGDARLGGREAIGQSSTGHRKAVGQNERLSDRSAPNLVDRACRHPFYGIENSDAREDGMLGIDRIAGVAGFMKGRFDQHVADLVGRCRAANRVIALDDERSAAGAGEQRSCRQAAQTGADHDDIVWLRHPSPPSPSRDAQTPGTTRDVGPTSHHCRCSTCGIYALM